MTVLRVISVNYSSRRLFNKKTKFALKYFVHHRILKVRSNKHAGMPLQLAYRHIYRKTVKENEFSSGNHDSGKV